MADCWTQFLDSPSLDIVGLICFFCVKESLFLLKACLLDYSDVCKNKKESWSVGRSKVDGMTIGSTCGLGVSASGHEISCL